jgi:prepilin-type N-terminal cleavage/methylation domain-containing protein
MARPGIWRHRQSQHKSASRRRAFTLIELLVAITIIAVLSGILLPSLDRARKSSQATNIKSDLSKLAIAVQNYHDMYDTYPSRGDLVLSGLLDCDTFLCDGDEIRHKTRSRTYTIVAADDTSFTLRTDPIAPFDYGAFVFTRDTAGTVVELPADNDALASEAAARTAADLRLMLASARIISEADNPADANQVLTFLDTVDSADLLSALFNTDMDETLTRNELIDFTLPQPDDPEELLQIRIAFADALQIVDPYGDAEHIPLADLQGDPKAFFFPPNYRLLIGSLVTKKGIANSLSVKVEAAVAALDQGEDDKAIDSLNAFKKELKAQTGKAVSADNALLLNSMVGVLYPLADGE